MKVPRNDVLNDCDDNKEDKNDDNDWSFIVIFRIFLNGREFINSVINTNFNRGRYLYLIKWSTLDIHSKEFRENTFLAFAKAIINKSSRNYLYFRKEK